MNFLLALQKAKEQTSRSSEIDTIKICASCSSNLLATYLNAYANLLQLNIKYEQSQFGTFFQTLEDIKNQSSNQLVLILVFPWDIQRLTSWRDNPSTKHITIDNLIYELEFLHTQISSIDYLSIHYFHFPFPSHQFDTDVYTKAQSLILNQMVQLNNMFVHGPELFSLSSFIKTGEPFNQLGIEALGKSINAEIISNYILYKRRARKCKVIFTDLDATFWPGVLAEDGYEAISKIDNDNAMRHLHYRMLLSRFVTEGVLVVAVSRNDFSYVNDALLQGILGFKNDQFTSILCNYNKKSETILEFLENINLMPYDAIFVDDNHLEILEVKNHIPDINTCLFSVIDDQYLTLINSLEKLLGSNQITLEDRRRPSLYSSMISFNKEVKAFNKIPDSKPLLNYLNNLSMQLEVCIASSEADVLRAIQLINKTSQFNCNGNTISSMKKLPKEYTIVIGSLKDSAIDHGVILACLITSNKTIESLVMSCRVFQRGIEEYFLSHLIKIQIAKYISLKKTPKNHPFINFIQKYNKDSIKIDQNEIQLNLDSLEIILPSHKVSLHSQLS